MNEEQTNSKSSDESDYVNYFAIGSMCNKVSLSMRNLHPLDSHPAEILDHEIYFFGKMGFAEAIYKPNASFHGVLHKMLASDKSKLDEMEFLNDQKFARVKLYDGTIINDALVYVRNDAERSPEIDFPPSERYLDIIKEGCRSFGVKDEYIRFLDNHEAQPRKNIEDLKKIAVPTDINLPSMSISDVISANGKDSNPLYMFINGKVIELLPESSPCNRKSFFGLYADFKERGHHSIAVVIFTMMYDPKYGAVKNIDDITQEMADLAEDIFVDARATVGNRYRVVGMLEDVDAKF